LKIADYRFVASFQVNLFFSPFLCLYFYKKLYYGYDHLAFRIRKGDCL